MVTIVEIAREAGVSVATVSRVLNNRAPVSAHTKDKVLETVERLGYFPNQSARNLRKKETGTILVMVPNITNLYYAHVFKGITEQAQKEGYNLFLCNTGDRSQEEILRDVIEKRQADGAILLAVNENESWVDRYSEGFPIVQCCEFALNSRTPHVSIDNYQAAYKATEYLISFGFRKIGMIGTTNRFLSTRMRYKGFYDALAKAGIEVRKEYMEKADESYSYSSSLKAAERLICGKELPEALFCIGDETALAVTTTAAHQGIRIPEQMSIVSVDDITYATIMHPYLTTIRQPCSELGQKAMELLVARIRGECLKEVEVIIPFEFIERESVCKTRYH